MPGPSTAELNGLNPHVQVEPLTLAIVSLPPTLVEEALVEELFELPPHPATTSDTIDTKATNVSHLKRFIRSSIPETTLRRVQSRNDPICEMPKQKEYIVGSGTDQPAQRFEAHVSIARAARARALRDLAVSPPESRLVLAACRATAIAP